MQTRPAAEADDSRTYMAPVVRRRSQSFCTHEDDEPIYSTADEYEADEEGSGNGDRYVGHGRRSRHRHKGRRSLHRHGRGADDDDYGDDDESHPVYEEVKDLEGIQPAHSTPRQQQQQQEEQEEQQQQARQVVFFPHMGESTTDQELLVAARAAVARSKAMRASSDDDGGCGTGSEGDVGHDRDTDGDGEGDGDGCSRGSERLVNLIINRSRHNSSNQGDSDSELGSNNGSRGTDHVEKAASFSSGQRAHRPVPPSAGRRSQTLTMLRRNVSLPAMVEPPPVPARSRIRDGERARSPLAQGKFPSTSSLAAMTAAPPLTPAQSSPTAGSPLRMRLLSSRQGQEDASPLSVSPSRETRLGSTEDGVRPTKEDCNTSCDSTTSAAAVSVFGGGGQQGGDEGSGKREQPRKAEAEAEAEAEAAAAAAAHRHYEEPVKPSRRHSAEQAPASHASVALDEGAVRGAVRGASNTEHAALRLCCGCTPTCRRGFALGLVVGILLAGGVAAVLWFTL